MKSIYLLLFLLPFCFQCKKDINPIDLLPPVTDTGANTFGCLVNGLAMLPRDGVPNLDNPYSHKGIEPVFGSNKKSVDLNFYHERDKAPTPFYLGIHLIDNNYIRDKAYGWQQTSYNSGYVDHWLHHIYGSFYDNETKNYEWFGSYEGSGATTITRFDTINHIISGTFSGNLRKRGGAKEITISNGRFDINWGTVWEKKFP